MDEIVFEKAYVHITQKGKECIKFIDQNGIVHYISKEPMTKYSTYTGKPYTSKEYKAYTYNEKQKTKSNSNNEEAL